MSAAAFVRAVHAAVLCVLPFIAAVHGLHATASGRALHAETIDLEVQRQHIRNTHCQLTTGDWCIAYWSQAAVPWKPYPRGDTACTQSCNGKGWCDYDSGVCHCRAGWDGAACEVPLKRPCWGMGPDKRDLGWNISKSWVHSRCAGLCDDEVGMCYCPPETRYGWQGGDQPNATGAPSRARPLYWCHPSSDAHGNKVPWGAMPYAALFGPDGWCNADTPVHRCPCRIDGRAGDFCQIRIEETCPNQCAGRGKCLSGFCLCHEGFYGHDCSRARKGLNPPHIPDLSSRPWLQAVVRPVPAAGGGGLTATRKRPLIYVYDLPEHLFSWQLQYRIERSHCLHRAFELGNVSATLDGNYHVDAALHELLLISEHRTLDPEEADYFFVPHKAVCYIMTLGHNTLPSIPAGGVFGPRPFHIAYFLVAAKRWVQQHLPYWNRTGGADHIWVTSHDEGACYVPAEVWPGIMLTHWARTDFPHTSGSQYHADNYTCDMPGNSAWSGSWLDFTSKTHACFDPVKDLAIPPVKYPRHYHASPFMGGSQGVDRDILLFFRGDVALHRREERCVYSRCIRQRLLNISREQQWDKHNCSYGATQHGYGDYSSQLARAKFCLVLPGDGWSARMEDAVLHGCVPVIIQDDVQVTFESVLDVQRFSLRLAQADLHKVLATVEAVTPNQLLELQEGLAKVWHRYRWNGLPLMHDSSRSILEENRVAAGGVFRNEQPGRERAGNAEDDAFSTIMQWLLARIPHTRQASPVRLPAAQAGAGAAP